jgi:hypothetical protein
LDTNNESLHQFPTSQSIATSLRTVDTPLATIESASLRIVDTPPATIESTSLRTADIPPSSFASASLRTADTPLSALAFASLRTADTPLATIVSNNAYLAAYSASYNREVLDISVLSLYDLASQSPLTRRLIVPNSDTSSASTVSNSLLNPLRNDIATLDIPCFNLNNSSTDDNQNANESNISKQLLIPNLALYRQLSIDNIEYNKE